MSKLSLDGLVDRYLAEGVTEAAKDEAFFGDKDLSVALAVVRAARSICEDGLLHPHQRRWGHKVAIAMADAIRPFCPDFETAQDFASVLAIVETALRPLHGVGDLAIYDVAHRIGIRIDVEPEKIYLHCGTKDGARALRLNWRAPAIEHSDLPVELRRLSASQAEDFLCLYKRQLHRFPVR